MLIVLSFFFLVLIGHRLDLILKHRESMRHDHQHTATTKICMYYFFVVVLKLNFYRLNELRGGGRERSQLEQFFLSSNNNKICVDDAG
jgi:hypothetical protein